MINSNIGNYSIADKLVELTQKTAEGVVICRVNGAEIESSLIVPEINLSVIVKVVNKSSGALVKKECIENYDVNSLQVHLSILSDFDQIFDLGYRNVIAKATKMNTYFLYFK